LVPAADPIAHLSRTSDSLAGERANLQSAARVLGVRLLPLVGATESKIAAAFATIVEQRAGALLTGAGAMSVAALHQFIAGLVSAAAWPLAAREQSALPVMGLLMSTSRETNLERLAAFREGLSKTGYVEMRNVAIEYRSAHGQYERLPALAAELVRRRVNVIVAGPGIPAALAAKSATTTIPVVFQSGVLHELIPIATSIALLVNPANPANETASKDMQTAARTLGVQLHLVHASADSDLDMVFANLEPVAGRRARYRG
jgi:ABC-type uncharacterized transport system substrate-binding protein